MRVLTVIGLLTVAACGRVGFNDNMDPMDPVLGNPIEAPPSNGLVAYWTFDNLTASGAMSAVSTDLASCNAGECPVEVGGIAGTAARFDGSTTCYHVPSLANLDSTSYTISAWVNVDSTATDQPMVMRYSGGCASPSLRGKNAQATHAAFDTNDIHQYAWTTDVLTAGTWQQVAIRWDGVNQSVFVDGVCSCNNLPTASLVEAVSNEYTLGCDAVDTTHFAGSMDELRIYNRALDNDEMAALVAEGGRVPPAPIACPMSCTITASF